LGHPVCHVVPLCQQGEIILFSVPEQGFSAEG
jgi:hypothetical protein